MAENNIAPKRMELAEGRVNPSLPSCDELADRLRRRVEFDNTLLTPALWLEVARVALEALSNDKV